MMKRRLTTIFLALAASGLAFADTITLKDGTKYEGKVLSEDAEAYVVAVQITASIKDERRILKADIESIDRSSADDLAFDKIKDLVPTPDRLTLKEYDDRINKQVKAFMEAFPSTKHKQQTGKILAILQMERELTAAGGLKLDGRWINPADREANAFEIDARILADSMKDAAEAGRLQTAMRKFEQLDKDFRASDSYPASVELAKTVLASYRPQISGGIKRVDALVPKRKAEFDLLPPSQRDAAYEDVARREKAYTALLEREQKSGTKWLSTEQYHKGPMEIVLRNIESEQKRLDGLMPDEIKKAGATYREAYAAAATGEKETATPLFTSLKAMNVPERYIAALEAKLEAKIAEIEGPPETDTPDSTDQPDGDMPDKTGSEPADGTDAPDAADDGTKTDDATSTDNSNEAPPVAPREPVADDDGSPMKNILFIVMAVVLVIALVAVFAGGKKKK